MTTETQRISIDGVTSIGNATITRPEGILFANNPVWMELAFDIDVEAVTIDVTGTPYGGEEKTFTIQCAVYGRRCRAYLSSIFQLFFNNPFAERGKTISVAVSLPLNDGALNIQVATYDFYVIWGCIRLGERMQSLGVFRYDARKPYFERTRMWYKNLPFNVTLLAETTDLQCRYDHLRYDQCDIDITLSAGLVDVNPSEHFQDASHIAVLKQPGAGPLSSSTFTSAFDYTFQVPGEFSVITRLIVSDETKGCYLRWIDTFGRLEYFLFVKGAVMEKYKPSATTKEVGGDIGGIYFPDMERNIATSSEITCKCCATLLPDSIYEYVRTIVRSSHVDLYMGKDRDGIEIWCPVKIVSGSLEYSRRPNLHDIEISFQMPSFNSPTL